MGKGKWYWKSDLRKKDEAEEAWTQYKPGVNSIIEHAYQSGKKTMSLDKLHGIDFRTMVQHRSTDYERQRDIKRESDSDSDSSDASRKKPQPRKPTSDDSSSSETVPLPKKKGKKRLSKAEVRARVEAESSTDDDDDAPPRKRSRPTTTQTTEKDVTSSSDDEPDVRPKKSRSGDNKSLWALVERHASTTGVRTKVSLFSTQSEARKRLKRDYQTQVGDDSSDDDACGADTATCKSGGSTLEWTVTGVTVIPGQDD